MTNNLVTKDYLDKRFVVFQKELISEITDLLSVAFENALNPIYKKLDKLDEVLVEIKDIKDITNNHEHRLDKHDDKFLTHPPI